jgi:hypothetical protein
LEQLFIDQAHGRDDELLVVYKLERIINEAEGHAIHKAAQYKAYIVYVVDFLVGELVCAAKSDTLSGHGVELYMIQLFVYGLIEPRHVGVEGV